MWFNIVILWNEQKFSNWTKCSAFISYLCMFSCNNYLRYHLTIHLFINDHQKLLPDYSPIYVSLIWLTKRREKLLKHRPCVIYKFTYATLNRITICYSVFQGLLPIFHRNHWLVILSIFFFLSFAIWVTLFTLSTYITHICIKIYFKHFYVIYIKLATSLN